MPIEFKVMSTRMPGEGKNGTPVWFPKLTGSSISNLEDLSKILSKRSTLSEVDIVAVITGLIDLIPEKLLDGHTVRLDGLGTFRLHARVKTSDNERNVTVKNIREIRLSFIPDNKIKKRLQGAKIIKMPSAP